MNDVEWSFVLLLMMLCMVVSLAFGIVLGFLSDKLNKGARPTDTYTNHLSMGGK